jgi:hypothetical protein
MERQYNIDEKTKTIWYEENGFRYSFTADEANSDYQAYLNPDKVEHLTEIPTPNEA